MNRKKYLQKADIRKYGIYEIILHQLFAASFLLLVITGLSLRFGGGGGISLGHAISGYIFIILFICHLILLAMKGLSEDIPLASLPFNVRIKELRDYLRGEQVIDQKYSIPERLDYMTMFFLSGLVTITGMLLRFPSLIPFGPKMDTIYGILGIHYFAAVAMIFWVFGYHLYFALLKPLPGNRPATMIGMSLEPEFILEHRPGWFAQIVERGIVEVIELEEDREKADREKVLELLSEANELVTRGEYAGAEVCFKEAIRLYPTYPQAHFNLAILYVKAGDAEKAKGQFKKFLEIDPFSSMAARARKMIRDMEED